MAVSQGILEWQSATPMPPAAKRAKDPEWERKQRQREYRVAARREKRNRKADEKKQRKLNATLLRRMTRNPAKYTKNADRNRLRAIELERRKIHAEAIKQMQRLAIVHDPSGKSFNIHPVVRLEDGSVISTETLRIREERRLAKEQAAVGEYDGVNGERPSAVAESQGQGDAPNEYGQEAGGRKLSKTQLKKQAMFAPRPPPPKPTLPVNVAIPEGEEDWLSLWDLPDDELDRRVKRAKRQAAEARKELRRRQQAGKAERRAARDEKRKVYRDLKMTWRSIKEEETRNRSRLKAAEEEEAKRIADQLSGFQREVALEECAKYGATIENTAGTEEIQPKVLGVKGATINFEAFERGDIPEPLGPKPNQKNKRVDLSAAAKFETSLTMSRRNGDQTNESDYITFDMPDMGDDADYEGLNYNHRLRRKIRRALEMTQMHKETLVREKLAERLREEGKPIPAILRTRVKPYHHRGYRILEDGSMENPKKQRVQARLELAEFNNAAKVLRRQAKAMALEAGLRVYAEMTGRIPQRPKQDPDKANDYGPGWHVPLPESRDDYLRPEDLTVV